VPLPLVPSILREGRRHRICPPVHIIRRGLRAHACPWSGVRRGPGISGASRRCTLVRRKKRHCDRDAQQHEPVSDRRLATLHDNRHLCGRPRLRQERHQSSSKNLGLRRLLGMAGKKIECRDEGPFGVRRGQRRQAGRFLPGIEVHARQCRKDAEPHSPWLIPHPRKQEVVVSGREVQVRVPAADCLSFAQ